MDGKWGLSSGAQGPGAMKPNTQSGLPPAMLSHAGIDHPLHRSAIVNNSLTKPDQFEQSTATARPAWLLISRVSDRGGRDDITGVHDESPSCSELDRRYARVLQPGSGPLRRRRPQTRTGDLAEERA